MVKNVSVPNLELKKLIYMYLVRHAGDQPDLALLSVNSFQRDLSDQNPLIRALALRVMSSIRLPIIQPIVLMAVQKCAKVGSGSTSNPQPRLPQQQSPPPNRTSVPFMTLAPRRTARRTCARQSPRRYPSSCRRQAARRRRRRRRRTRRRRATCARRCWRCCSSSLET